MEIFVVARTDLSYSTDSDKFNDRLNKWFSFFIYPFFSMKSNKRKKNDYNQNQNKFFFFLNFKVSATESDF